MTNEQVNEQVFLIIYAQLIGNGLALMVGLHWLNAKANERRKRDEEREEREEKERKNR